MKITAKWTGQYPAKCCGEWHISVDGEEMPLPEDIRRSHMNTQGSYSGWYFDDWLEQFYTYDDGVEFGEWSKNNANWIKDGFDQLGVTDLVTIDDVRMLYDAINENDWRHNSCGGCI